MKNDLEDRYVIMQDLLVHYRYRQDTGRRYRHARVQIRPGMDLTGVPDRVKVRIQRILLERERE